MRLLHTADWQLGKPFARIFDPLKRSLVQNARLEAVKRLAAVVEEAEVDLVVVAGDLFDSPSADRATVSAACSGIGQISAPVVCIPGNHDHGGPGSVWEQEFFQREQQSLAPNFTVLLDAAPYEVAGALILPCPLLRRSVVADPTEWLRQPAAFEGLSADLPRIVLTHGSTQAFVGEGTDDEEDSGGLAATIDIDRIPGAQVDYVALGDWHGAKQVGSKAWYSGSPEPDRFPKGAHNDPGNVLIVDVVRGVPPSVSVLSTGALSWHEATFDFADDSSVAPFETLLTRLLGQRANQDLLRLTLTGTLGIDASDCVERVLESLEARLLRLKLVNRTTLAPTSEEIRELALSGTDPLIGAVAGTLVAQAQSDDEGAAVARIALRELYAVRSRLSAKERVQ